MCLFGLQRSVWSMFFDTMLKHTSWSWYWGKCFLFIATCLELRGGEGLSASAAPQGDVGHCLLWPAVCITSLTFLLAVRLSLPSPWFSFLFPLSFLTHFVISPCLFPTLLMLLSFWSTVQCRRQALNMNTTICSVQANATSVTVWCIWWCWNSFNTLKINGPGNYFGTRCMTLLLKQYQQDELHVSANTWTYYKLIITFHIKHSCVRYKQIQKNLFFSFDPLKGSFPFCVGFWKEKKFCIFLTLIMTPWTLLTSFGGGGCPDPTHRVFMTNIESWNALLKRNRSIDKHQTWSFA